MAVKSSKNTIASSYFRASLIRWAENSHQRKNVLAAELNISPSNFSDYLHGVKSPSLAQMEEISNKIGNDLVGMLTEGRSILAGEAPLEVKPSPSSTTKNDELEWLKRENELLRNIIALKDQLAEKYKMPPQQASALAEKDDKIGRLEAQLALGENPLVSKQMEGEDGATASIAAYGASNKLVNIGDKKQ